ncbi:MAG TPA: hypothetical protein VH417_18300 [Vicinamibacterales bacterium]|jgi:hypothetical protein
MKSNLWIVLAAAALSLPAAVQAQSFRPPQDGRLSSYQIQTYLDVRRAAAAAGPAATRVAAADLGALVGSTATRELEAARNAGMDADEYRWVRQRIADARSRSGGERPALVDLIERRVMPRVASLQKTLNPGASDQTNDAAREESAREFNRSLVEAFAGELEALDHTAAGGDGPRP